MHPLPVHPSNPDAKIHSILSVEDNASDIFLLREALKEYGIAANLTIFGDGESAISYLGHMQKEAFPELVMLDLNLPKKDGLAVLGYLRGNPALRELPVVMFTASDSIRDRDKALGLGLDAFVRKSQDLHEYLSIGAIVKGVLQKHENS